jgi:uncharacterized protein (TIGR02444 family)
MRDATPLWRFSLAYYAKPGIPEVLIALQDEHGIDVNVLLLVLWLASEERVIDDDEMERIAEHSRGWQEAVVSPLRAVRRALKTNMPLVAAAAAEPFRNKIKAIELEAEHIQQDALYEIATRLPQTRSVAPDEAGRRNIAAYAAFAGCRFPDASIAALLTALREMPRRSQA